MPLPGLVSHAMPVCSLPSVASVGKRPEYRPQLMRLFQCLSKKCWMIDAEGEEQWNLYSLSRCLDCASLVQSQCSSWYQEMPCTSDFLYPRWNSPLQRRWRRNNWVIVDIYFDAAYDLKDRRSGLRILLQEDSNHSTQRIGSGLACIIR